jgi:hypothetical protein
MRLIDADKLLQKLNNDNVSFNSTVNNYILEAPAIDVESTLHAHWIKSGRFYDYDITCSHCGNVHYGLETDRALDDYNYCSKCGAKME